MGEKMRVLICATEYYPDGSGIANVMYNVVRELEGMGVEYTICSPTGPDIKLGDLDHIKKYGILGMLQYWYQVSRHLESNDYDVAWLQNPFIVTRNPFKHCLVTMHATYYGARTYAIGNLPLHLYKSLVTHLERYCLTRMPTNTFFTGVGKPVCEELENIGIARDRMVYIPNGVNIRRFRPLDDKKPMRKKFGIPEDDVILLSVGRLTQQKQPYTMIEVFSHLEKEVGNVTLCIAGKGDLLEETKDLAEKIGLRKVLFLGYVDDRDLPDLYACSDYYIMTSKYEGGMPPLTLAEAMASGLPCIVSDIPNLAIVKDADCGIILNFGNVSTASDQILDYISNECSEHSQNARRYAIDQLDWHLISEQYLKMLLEIKHGEVTLDL
ncbi:glycosyltransferase family 4 protein [Methanosarcina sp. T3]|uniref:glycosyltransferase family 4 protein n=1 Tax=Methanosarcina sp. T3 TaxID=3439062 RepID=UPI003F8546E5